MTLTLLLIIQHTIFLCPLNYIKSCMLHFHTIAKYYGFSAFFKICSIIQECMHVFSTEFSKRKKTILNRFGMQKLSTKEVLHDFL